MPNEPVTTRPSPAPPGTLDVPVAGESPTSFSAMTPAAGLGEAPAAPRGRMPFVVWMGILAALAISAVSIALLYSRWYHIDDPTVNIIVGWPAQWDGATVRITGSSLPYGELSRPLKPEENGGNRVIRFHVPPGYYQIAVLGGDGRRIAETMSNPAKPLGSRTNWWPFEAPAVDPPPGGGAATRRTAAPAARPASSK